MTIKITAQQGKKMMEENPTITLVDVRTDDEYKEERIPGSRLVQVDELDNLAPRLIPNKEAAYILYCRTGSRSAVAASQLTRMGYQNIYDMGGIIDWPYETVRGNV